MVAAMSRSRIVEAIGAASAGLVGYTVLTKPKPYPPDSWSEEANAFPEYIRLGLGPFHYYCEEKGAVTPVDRIPEFVPAKDIKMMHRLKPGIDSRIGGFVATTPDSYSVMSEETHNIIRNYGKKEFNLEFFLKKFFPNFSVHSTSANIRVSKRMNIANRDFNSIVSFANRRENESKICEILEKYFAGSYHPLGGSQSRKTTCMSPVLLDVLRSQDLMFEAPWTVFDLSAGFGRHWPDARGVWILPATDGNQIVFWINHEDHLEIVGVREDGDAVRLNQAIETICEKIEQILPVAKSDEFGYLSAKPENCGNAISVSKSIDLNRLSKHRDFPSLIAKLGINSTPLVEGGWYQIASKERFGTRSDEMVERANFAFQFLASVERMLQSGSSDQSRLAETIIDKLASV